MAVFKRINSRKGRTSHILRGFRVRLMPTVLVLALTVIAMTDAVWMFSNTHKRERQHLAALQSKVELLLLAAAAGTRLEDAAAIEQVGMRLSKTGLVKGGTIYNLDGAKIARFGRPTALTWTSALSRNIRRQAAQNGCCYDIFFDPGDTGLGYGFVLRIDASHIERAARAEITAIGGAIAVVAGMWRHVFFMFQSRGGRCPYRV